MLNGIRGWTLTSVRSPTNRQLRALSRDIASPFDPSMIGWRPRIHRRQERYRRIRLDDWTFVTVNVAGPRRSDFDVYLYRGNARGSFEHSRRTGRRERLATILPPGLYDVGVYAYRGSGRAAVRIDLD